MQHHITERINSLLKERQMTATELAAGAGVSDATISKIRNSQYSGSVSFEVIQRICHFLDLPLEYFERMRPEKSPVVTMRFHDFALGSGKNVYKKYMEKCLGQETLYISNTIPDALKTLATILAERRTDEQVGEYAKYMKETRENAFILNNLYGSFFIDENIFNQLIQRRGAYVTLTKYEVIDQIKIITDFFSRTFPRVHGYVVNYSDCDISTAFVVNKRIGAQFAFGGYFEWESEYMGELIHNKAVSAINKSVSIAHFLQSATQAIEGSPSESALAHDRKLA